MENLQEQINTTDMVQHNLGTGLNPHIRDINSKTIFSNAIMCAQFLRDNTNIPLLKDIAPEDIEDVTERLLPYAGTEYFGDTVKKLRIHRGNETQDLYVISLIEHKSKVDYNVIMQILRYMVGIWHEYEKDMKKSGKNIEAKSFRYPPILPIVYYEGAAEWTADMHLKDRILLSELFEEYIPDFTYKVVRNHDYSNEELLAREDEMSLLMLINKIQRAEDWKELAALPKDKLNRIIEHSPQAVLDILASTIFSLCRKMNVPEEETKQYIKLIREEQNMGYLFENMEKMDIQAERRNTAEARAEVKAMKEKLEKTEAKLEKAMLTSLNPIIRTCQELGASQEITYTKIMQNFDLTSEQAEAAMNKFWQK